MLALREARELSAVLNAAHFNSTPKERNTFMHRVALLAVLIAIFCSTTYAIAQPPGETHRVTLHPRLNAVAWLGETTSISDLFQHLPQEVYWVFHWNSNQQTGRWYGRDSDAESTSLVSTGQSMYIWGAANQTVRWEQQSALLVEFIALTVGRNDLAWAGDDEASFAQVVSSIGDALTSAQYWDRVREKWISLDVGDPSQETKRFNRGDTLVAYVDREARYHPAAGSYPDFRWWWDEDPNTAVMNQIDNAVRKTVDYIAEEYRLHAFAESGWSIAFGAEAWLNGWQGRRHVDTETGIKVMQLRDLIERVKSETNTEGCFGLVNGEGLLLVVFPTSGSVPTTCLDDQGSGVLVHEYTHVVQRAFRYPLDTPTWLVEGHARWVEHLWLVQHHTLPGERESLIRYATRQVDRCDNTPLSTTSYEDIEEEQCAYRLGFLAVAVLMDKSTDDGMLMWEYLERSRYEGYYSAFESIFDIALHDFYLEFSESKARWVSAECSESWADKVVDMRENPDCWSFQPEESTAPIEAGGVWDPGPSDLRSGEVVRLWSDYVHVYYVTHSAQGVAIVRHIPNWADFSEANCSESDIRHVERPSQQITYGLPYPPGEFQGDASRHCH